MTTRKKRYHNYEIEIDGEMVPHRIHYASQCPFQGYHPFRLGDKRRCQGVKGHEGDHWSYDPSGTLLMWTNRKEVKSRSARVASWIPPGHKFYVHPIEKFKLYYERFHRVEIRVEIRNVKKRKKAK